MECKDSHHIVGRNIFDHLGVDLTTTIFFDNGAKFFSHINLCLHGDLTLIEDGGVGRNIAFCKCIELYHAHHAHWHRSASNKVFSAHPAMQVAFSVHQVGKIFIAPETIIFFQAVQTFGIGADVPQAAAFCGDH